MNSIGVAFSRRGPRPDWLWASAGRLRRRRPAESRRCWAAIPSAPSPSPPGPSWTAWKTRRCWRCSAAASGSAAAARGSTNSRPPTPSSPARSTAWPPPTAPARCWPRWRRLEIGPGDEVILPPYTFVATLNVVLHAVRPAHLRRFRPGDLPDRRRQDRSGHHRPDGPDPAGAPGRVGRRHGHDPGRRRQAQAAGGRGRLPVPPGRVAGPEGGHAGARPAASASR